MSLERKARNVIVASALTLAGTVVDMAVQHDNIDKAKVAFVDVAGVSAGLLAAGSITRRRVQDARFERSGLTEGEKADLKDSRFYSEAGIIGFTTAAVALAEITFHTLHL